MALRIAFEMVLRRKGRALDAMRNSTAALRRRATPEDLALLDELGAARSRLAELSLATPSGEADRRREEIRDAERRLEQLQARVSYRSASVRVESLPVTLASVRP